MRQEPRATRRARRLRAEPTLAGRRLWEMIRDRRLDGLKFRRETPLAGVTVDFFCPELKLVIELDGGVHRLRVDEDAARDARLAAAGFHVIRIANEAYLSNPNPLIARIRERAASVRRAPPHPSASGAHLLPRGEKG